jgi:hypothetical protein
MFRRQITVGKYEAIKSLIAQGESDRSIERATGSSRNTVRQIRSGEITSPEHGTQKKAPSWSLLVDWPKTREQSVLGDTVKDLWLLSYKELISYDSFLRQFHARYPGLTDKLIIHRHFNPGEYCEVDYAGMTVEYIDVKTGEIFTAPIFVGILNFSQLIYAKAALDMKTVNFLESHQKMFEFFKGVPAITVCDNLKQGVIKAHIYDPFLNESYQDFAKHNNTSIVPARPRRPQDKPLVEGAVRLVQRIFKLYYRNHTFTSVTEINEALGKVLTIINDERKHTFFKITRRERYKQEHASLRLLPNCSWEHIEYKICKVHADSHINLLGNYYSVPHIYRGSEVKCKIKLHQIEIYKCLDRIAVHRRSGNCVNKRITNLDHLPENAKAYHEATPKNILSQARYINVDLGNLIDELFNQDALANLRKSQGLISLARKELDILGEEKAANVISEATKTMKLFNKINYHYFKELLTRYRKQKATDDSYIQRNSNPHLRHSNVLDFIKKPMEVNLNVTFTSQEPNVRT